jgi:hypothetical protein
MAAKRLIKSTSGKPAGQAASRKVTKKTGKKTEKKVSRSKLSRLRSEAALRGWETRRKNERKAARAAKKTAKKTVKKAVEKAVKKPVKKVAKKAAVRVAPKPHKFLGSERGAVRGITSRADLQEHFDKHKITDRRKSIERILADYQAARIGERPKQVLELRKLYKQRFAKQSKDRLLKYYSVEDRKRYQSDAYSVSLIRQLLEADASYLLEKALEVLDKDRKRAYSILRREVAADPYGTAKQAVTRLRQLVTLTPPPEFVESDESVIIGRLLDAIDMGNEDEVAHQCATEYGMDLRTVYTLLHSPNSLDFI